ncbi:MAG: hypothetical protein NXI27_04885 [Alphaproteobacteria bacterium]|nr:hypothetical protein [Alphaproteobacteria bacterium]
MKEARRSILKGGAVVAAASVLPVRLSASDAPNGTAFDKAHATTQAVLADHFVKLGYQRQQPAPIVTRDESFNGGLRYDETGILEKPGQLMFQQCTRLEDIARKDRRDVLPLFHIFTCSKPLGFTAKQTFPQILAGLTQSLNLDPARLAFVSTPRLNDFLPLLEKANVETIRQVYLREDAEALANPDGSGYYRFPGAPDTPILPTAGIYYWIGDGPPQPITSYPPSDDWTEIGEISIDDDDRLAFGMGTERLTLASTGMISSWQERLAQLLEYIELDSSGASPPSGRAQFIDG